MLRTLFSSLTALWLGGGCGASARHGDADATPITPSSSSLATPDAASSAPIAVAPVQVPLPTGPIGTAHPFTFVAADPDARWVVTCQAREDTDGDGAIRVGIGHHGDTFGDAMRPYLVLGAGAGIALDAFVAADRSGNHVAYVQDGKLRVHDVVRGTTLDLSALGANANDDANPFGAHRALSFDRDGGRLLYLRDRGANTVAVVRDVERGSEAELSFGAGLVWRAAFSREGDYVIGSVVANDTDGDGKLSLPTMRTSLSKRGCRGPVTSYSTNGMQGDAIEARYVPSGGGSVRSYVGTIGNLGSTMIVKGPSDLALQEDTTRTPIGTGSCDLLHADGVRGRLVYRCDNELFWWSKATGPRSLGFKDQHPSISHAWLLDPSPRYLPLDVDPLSLLDLESGALIPLGRHEVATVLLGDRALVMRRGADSRVTHSLLEIARNERTVIRRGSSVSGTERVNGALLALDGKVFDLKRGTEIRSYSPEPLALANDGQTLHAARRPGRQPRGLGDELPVGPLEWSASK